MSAEKKKGTDKASKSKAVKKTTKKSTVAGKKVGVIDHVFSGDLTLRRVTEVKEAFAKAVTSSKTVRFSFKDVDEIDLSFVQALCSAHRTANDDGKKVLLEGDFPEAFTSLLKEAGLNVHVGCSLGADVDCPWLEKNHK